MSLYLIPNRIKDICLSDRGLIGLAVINFIGTLFGFYYYIPQFSEMTSILWLFVADSPIATFLIGVSFLMHRYGKQYSLIDLMAFIGNIKYGLWTVFVLIYYFQTFWTGNSTPMYLFLVLSHFGMFLQAFLVYEYSEFGLKATLAGGSWFIINDLFDYFLDIHTYVYAEHSHPMSLIMMVAVSLTSIGIILSYRNQSS